MSGAKLGRTFVLKSSDGAAGWIPIAGITSKSLDINGERVDATVPDANTPEGVLWRCTLDGVKSVDFSGDGKMVPGVPMSRLVTTAMSQEMTDDYQLIVPGLGTFEGTYSINLGLGDDGTVTFSISAQSQGAITFTAE